MLEVIIPARNEPYLNKTIQEVFDKATGDVSVTVIADGYEPKVLSLVKYLRYPDGECHLRQGITEAVRLTKAKYVMKLDSHCMLARGFDTELIKASQPNWVQVPRRKRLDAEKWEVIEDGRPDVDYEFIIFSNLTKGLIWGTPWDEITKERAHILIDDTPHIQGSCFFMEREWFQKNSFLDFGYGGWGQEAEEITFTTFREGGRTVVNKKTWYAHLHKDIKARKWFTLKEQEYTHSHAYSFNLWVKNNRELFTRFIKQFPPMPSWPDIYEKILWN